jgi:hypothetical protein
MTTATKKTVTTEEFEQAMAEYRRAAEKVKRLYQQLTYWHEQAEAASRRLHEMHKAAGGERVA